MGKNSGKSNDKVSNEMRKRALEKCHLPEAIRKSYTISVKNGRVALSKKKS